MCKSWPSGAAGRFKLDYWAASYREDVNALAAFLKQRDTKDHCDQALHGRPIYRTQRLDTTLSVVLDLHPV
jgi:hypothetical protein